MKKITVYPFIFDFKMTVPQKISKAKMELFNFCLSSVFPNSNFEWCDYNFKDNNIILTIPISETILINKSTFLRDYLTEKITNNQKLFNGDKFVNEFVVFIDVYSLDRQQMLFHLSMELNSLLLKDSMKNRIIFFISSFVKGFSELSFLPINPFIENNAVVIFDEIGNVSDKNIDKQLNKMTFQNIHSKTSPDLNNLLETKFIRRLGHFRRENIPNNNLCQRTYYDGRFCKEEIFELLKNNINNQIHRKRILGIFYYAEESPWLKESIYVLNTYLNPKYGANNMQKMENVPFNRISKDEGLIVVITDLINKGTTLISCLGDLMKKLPEKKIYNYLFFSILNNAKSSNSSKNKIRLLPMHSEKIRVNYFMDVDFKETHTNNCIQCKLGIEHDAYSEDIDTAIRSFDFWELSIVSKFKREDFVPKNRKGLQVMPNYIDLLNKEYASYFAYKFKNIFESKNISSDQITIVIPDETKRKNATVKNIEDTSSGRFATALSELFGINFIAVPRNILENIDDYFNNIASYDNEIWFSQLREVKDNIVILDEVNVSGGTFDSLYSIITGMDKEPLCYFSLLDLNPQKTKQKMTQHKGLQFHNLYEFQY